MRKYNYFIFISSNEILEYSGQPLKRYVGNKLIKVISNPTDSDLVEFGYKPLVKEKIPEFDSETEYIEKSYINEIDRIIERHEAKSIPQTEITK